MGYEVRPDGTIIASTLDEAIALSKRLRQESLQPGSPRPARNNGQNGRPVSPEEVQQKVTALLNALATAGKPGLSSTALATQLGLVNPKGLSSYVVAAKRVIKDKGGRPEKLLWRKRTAKEGAIWHTNVEKLKEIGIM